MASVLKRISSLEMRCERARNKENYTFFLNWMIIENRLSQFTESFSKILLNVYIYCKRSEKFLFPKKWRGMV